MKEPTMEEVLKLVSFRRDDAGTLYVSAVYGDVGNVHGNVHGWIDGNVGNVHGDVSQVGGDIGTVGGNVDYVRGKILNK